MFDASATKWEQPEQYTTKGQCIVRQWLGQTTVRTGTIAFRLDLEFGSTPQSHWITAA